MFHGERQRSQRCRWTAARYESVHEGLEGGSVFEINGDDAAAAAQAVGRLDALDYGVGSAAGGKDARLGGLVAGFQLPPGMVEDADEEALGIAHLNSPAAQRDGEVRAKLSEAGLVVSGADDEKVSVGAIAQGIGAGTVTRKAGIRFGG